VGHRPGLDTELQEKTFASAGANILDAPNARSDVQMVVKTVKFFWVETPYRTVHR
jgi:hypothetical protein